MTVRVAILDSGVNPEHPHVGGVAGGVGISASGESGDYLDRLGHGTAVAAVIHEKAPQAQLYAVKVFDRALNTTIDRILRGLAWAIDHRMHVVNLSLGADNPAHRPGFEQAITRAAEAGVVLVAARSSLPGSLAGVLQVEVDWDCPRDSYQTVVEGGRLCFRASGYPRPMPGVAPKRNLHGISFAVANITGFVARDVAHASACWRGLQPTPKGR